MTRNRSLIHMKKVNNWKKNRRVCSRRHLIRGGNSGKISHLTNFPCGRKTDNRDSEICKYRTENDNKSDLSIGQLDGFRFSGLWKKLIFAFGWKKAEKYSFMTRARYGGLGIN